MSAAQLYETDTDLENTAVYRFCLWLAQEFQAGNQGIDIDCREMPDEKAQELLRKIKQSFTEHTGIR